MAASYSFSSTILDMTGKVQDTITETLDGLVETVGDVLPELPIDGASDMVAKAGELVDAGYGLAQDLLVSNRAFVATLYTAAGRLVDAATSTPEPAVKAAPKASAKKSTAKAA